MPQDDTADFAALFRNALDEPVDEPEDQEPGEGERQAQSDSPPEKETPGKKKEAAPAPQTDKQDEIDASETPDARYEELLEEVKRLKKYEPLVELFEAEPDLARQALARRLGFPQSEPAQQSSAEPTTAQPDPQVAEEYWRDRLEKDPASAVRDLITVATNEATKGSRNASSRVLINDYKSRRRAEDPLFREYEEYFDALARGANPDFIINYPDQTMAAVENLALGTWAREQRQKALAARKARPSVAREKPRNLEENKVTAPAQPAKKRRELTEEERELARVYGEESLDLEDDAGNPWRG